MGPSVGKKIKFLSRILLLMIEAELSPSLGLFQFVNGYPTASFVGMSGNSSGVSWQVVSFFFDGGDRFAVNILRLETGVLLPSFSPIASSDSTADL